MPESDSTFTGSIPDIYDRYMVPLIFQDPARDLAARLAALAPGTVLETACGTGALTRAMAAALPVTTRITATDLNAPMLAIAAARLPDDTRITWQPADALALPFADQSFDAVTCQFGVMFFPDKLAGYREAHRVLRPGGAFVFNVWTGLADNAFVEVVAKTLTALFPDDPPNFMARTPHGYHDAGLIEQTLREAGFTSVAVDTVDYIARAATPYDAALAYCQGNPNRIEIETRKPGGVDSVTRTVADALARSFGPGPIQGPLRARIITARRQDIRAGSRKT